MDRMEALKAVQADALALAAKAKALGLDGATVDQLAASVSATLTEAAIKTRAPDSWRVTVRRWALVPVYVTVEVAATSRADAELGAELDVSRDPAPASDHVAGALDWLASEGGGVETIATAAEPVWSDPPAEPAPVDPEPEPVEPEPVKADEPVRIGGEVTVIPAPKDDGIYEAAAVRSR